MSEGMEMTRIYDEWIWPHLLLTTLDDFPNKSYKIEEAQGDMFTWQYLKDNFIKDFTI